MNEVFINVLAAVGFISIVVFLAVLLPKILAEFIMNWAAKVWVEYIEASELDEARKYYKSNAATWKQLCMDISMKNEDLEKRVKKLEKVYMTPDYYNESE
jgi:hypothetical protein